MTAELLRCQPVEDITDKTATGLDRSPELFRPTTIGSARFPIAGVASATATLSNTYTEIAGPRRACQRTARIPVPIDPLRLRRIGARASNRSHLRSVTA